MYPVITILGKTIGTYALCSVVGFFAAAYAAWRKGRKLGIAPEDVILLTLVIMGGVLVGGHLLYGVTRGDVVIAAVRALFSGEPLRQVWSLLTVAFGGSVFYGGFFGALLAVGIYTRRHPRELRNHERDLFVLVAPLFHAFGRIGCFLGGCCYGVESGFGFIVEENPFVPELCGVRRLPVSLIEAFANLAIFFVLLFLYDKKKKQGRLVLYYGILYPVVRFTLEFFRGDAIRGVFAGLSTSQWISMVFFTVSILGLVRDSAARKKSFSDFTENKP